MVWSQKTWRKKIMIRSQKTETKKDNSNLSKINSTQLTHRKNLLVWPCCSYGRCWRGGRYQRCSPSTLMRWRHHWKSLSCTRWWTWLPRTAESDFWCGWAAWGSPLPVWSDSTRPCGTTWTWTWSSCDCRDDALCGWRASAAGSRAERPGGCCPGEGCGGSDRRWGCAGWSVPAACCWWEPGIPASACGPRHWAAGLGCCTSRIGGARWDTETAVEECKGRLGNGEDGGATWQWHSPASGCQFQSQIRQHPPPPAYFFPSKFSNSGRYAVWFF